MADLSWHKEVKTCVVCGVDFGPISSNGILLQKSRWKLRIVCDRRCVALRRHGGNQRTVQNRFEEYYEKKGNNECWVWTGGKTKDGYGRIRVDNRPVGAHVYAYTRIHGPVPKGMLIRHTCDNPPCVNPAHLLIGTHTDNARDKIERGRHGCLNRDTGAPRAKYKTKDVLNILTEWGNLPKYPNGNPKNGLSKALYLKHGITSKTMTEWRRKFSPSF